MTEFISHVADIYAIPFFGLSTFYFYNIKNKNKIEYILFLFSISGLIADILFTIFFINSNNDNKIYINIIILIILFVIIFTYDNIILI
jgi:hypothetical protein